MLLARVIKIRFPSANLLNTYFKTNDFLNAKKKHENK